MRRPSQPLTIEHDINIVIKNLLPRFNVLPRELSRILYLQGGGKCGIARTKLILVTPHRPHKTSLKLISKALGRQFATGLETLFKGMRKG
jgi:hypothetical protein